MLHVPPIFRVEHATCSQCCSHCPISPLTQMAALMYEWTTSPNIFRGCRLVVLNKLPRRCAMPWQYIVSSCQCICLPVRDVWAHRYTDRSAGYLHSTSIMLIAGCNALNAPKKTFFFLPEMCIFSFKDLYTTCPYTWSPSKERILVSHDMTFYFLHSSAAVLVSTRFLYSEVEKRCARSSRQKDSNGLLHMKYQAVKRGARSQIYILNLGVQIPV